MHDGVGSSATPKSASGCVNSKYSADHSRSRTSPLITSSRARGFVNFKFQSSAWQSVSPAIVEVMSHDVDLSGSCDVIDHVRDHSLCYIGSPFRKRAGRFQDIGLSTLSSRHWPWRDRDVTSSVTCPCDHQVVISFFRCFIAAKSISPTVVEIMGPKYIGVITMTFQYHVT